MEALKRTRKIFSIKMKVANNVERCLQSIYSTLHFLVAVQDIPVTVM